MYTRGLTYVNPAQVARRSLVAPLTPEDLLGMRQHEMVLRIAAGEHRPFYGECWESPWSTVSSPAVSSRRSPSAITRRSSIAATTRIRPTTTTWVNCLGHGLLITPTCDIRDSTTKSLRPVDPWPPPLTTFVVRSEVPLLHVMPGKVGIAVYA